MFQDKALYPEYTNNSPEFNSKIDPTPRRRCRLCGRQIQKRKKKKFDAINHQRTMSRILRV